MKYLLTIILSVSIIINIMGQCLNDTHSTFKNQGWLSCDTSPSPNSARGNSHWLMYDLGHKYVIDSLTIWNHNVWGETGSGAKQISIDVSNDKLNWTNVGTFAINKAPGSWKYQTDNIIQLNQATGQFFLITVLDNWDNNSSCRGIAEVRFGVGMSTSTEDIFKEENWTVYPNPTANNVSVDLKDKTDIQNISIVNALGQIVTSIANPRSGINTINVSEYEDGVYFVRIASRNDIENKAFVKIGVK